MYSSTGLVIEIALNNYGLKEIRRLNHNAIYDIRTSSLLNMSHLNRGSWIRTNAFWILFYPCTASSSKTTGIFPYMAASLPHLITFAVYECSSIWLALLIALINCHNPDIKSYAMLTEKRYITTLSELWLSYNPFSLPYPSFSYLQWFHPDITTSTLWAVS